MRGESYLFDFSLGVKTALALRRDSPRSVSRSAPSSLAAATQALGLAITDVEKLCAELVDVEMIEQRGCSDGALDIGLRGRLTSATQTCGLAEVVGLAGISGSG